MKTTLAKWIFIAVAVAGTCFALVKIAFFEFPKIRHLRDECQKEQAAVDKLKKERDRLASEVHDINVDPVVAEKYARKEGWIREGETVIIIPEKIKNGR